MASRYTKHLNAKQTPQTEPIPGKNMVKNNAGGYSFEVTPWTRLDRFLILGSDSNTYYQTAQALTRENAKSIEGLIRELGEGVVARTAAISDQGRAPKNDPAEFVLAMCAKFGDEKTRRAAFAALPKVCRIGTHLFHFVQAYQDLGGTWSSMSRKGVAGWYESKSSDQLGYQLAKYQSRDGWSHRDVLRLCHANLGADNYKQAVARWAVGGLDALKGQTKKEGSKRAARVMLGDHYLPKIIEGFEAAKRAETPKETARLIRDYNLPRECVQTEHLNDLDVWDALLPKMGLEALIRNLNKMTAIGLIKPLSAVTGLIKQKLASVDELKRARLHPLKVLTAGLRYSSGRGDKGSLTWAPVKAITDALEDAFYLAFDAAPAMDQNVMVALDVSGSMSGGVVGGINGLTPCMAGATLAMLMARREPNHMVHGFAGNFVDLDIGPKDTLQTAMRKAQINNFGLTDASIPMTYAKKEKLDVDLFLLITDNESWSGAIHPTQALREYRKASGRPAKIAAMTLTPTAYSTVEDMSNDAGALNLVGFDTAIPSILYDFATGGSARTTEIQDDE